MYACTVRYCIWEKMTMRKKNSDIILLYAKSCAVAECNVGSLIPVGSWCW
jgi:hypothetical protein